MASKGEAILRVCEYLGISPDECIAFGDQENDVSMFKTVKTGVAMGNSDSVIKEVADVVTDSVSNDGFSKYISKTFKGL